MWPVMTESEIRSSDLLVSPFPLSTLPLEIRGETGGLWGSCVAPQHTDRAPVQGQRLRNQSHKLTQGVHSQPLTPPHSQGQQQGKAGNVEIPLGTEKLHVEVFHGPRVVLDVHLLCHVIVLPDLTESIYSGAERRESLAPTWTSPAVQLGQAV